MRIGENEYNRMEFAGALGDLGTFIPLEIITQGMIWGSGIFTAIFWLVMGFTGAVS